MHKVGNVISINQQPNKRRKTKTAHTPLTLRGWVYAADGKHIKDLIQTSFLEFYFTNRSLEFRKNA